MTRRLASLALAAVLLSGCGFHLRNALSLPENLGPVRVLATDPYSPLGELLADGLKRAGAQAAPADATDAVATLQVLSEQWADTPISQDQFGRAQEFSLRYAVIFSMRRADGSAALPQQAVELSRDYLAPAVDSMQLAMPRPSSRPRWATTRCAPHSSSATTCATAARSSSPSCCSG